MVATKDFTVSEKLTALAKLQKLNSKLDQIQTLKGELPIEVSDLEDEVIGLNSRRTRIEEEINGITHYIEEKKEVIAQSAELIKKYEQQSENVKNNREFEAINSEMEMQQLEAQLAEKNIRDANADLSEKISGLEELKKKIAIKETAKNEKKTELDKIIAETDKEEQTLNEDIEQQREDMDERLLFSFDRIRNNYRNGLAVVPVERDACGGCFNAIPPQVQSEIRQRKKVMVCENCGRILIDDELNETVEI